MDKFIDKKIHKEKAACGEAAAHQKTQINPTEAIAIAQQRNRTISLVIERLSDDGWEVEHSSRTSGKVARSLLFLYASPNGLTRMESLDQWGILSLTQHVASLRHTHHLRIDSPTETFASIDGSSHCARYMLKSRVRLFLVGGEK